MEYITPFELKSDCVLSRVRPDRTAVNPVVIKLWGSPLTLPEHVSMFLARLQEQADQSDPPLRRAAEMGAAIQFLRRTFKKRLVTCTPDVSRILLNMSEEICTDF